MSFFAPKAELAIVFDIGSSSVGAGLVRLVHGEPVRVLHSVREAIPYQEKVDPDRLFRDMVDVLKRVHDRIVKDGAAHLEGTEFTHVNVRRAYYSFASPWSATQTKTLSIKKSEPFALTHDLLNSLMLDEEEKFKKEAIGAQRVFPEALSVIERRIIQTRLNGYEIKDPFGKKAREIDISYFTGIVPKSVLDKTIEVSHAAHISKNIKSFTFPLIAYGTIRETFPKENDFIHLRVGGEVSDVSIIEDGLITESASFPRGQNHVIRAVAKDLNMTKEEATSYLALHTGGHIDPNTADKSDAVVSKYMSEWVWGLREVLERLQSGMFLPQKLFLIMDGEVPGLFVEALSEDANNTNGLRVSFNVTPVNHDTLKSSVVMEGPKDAPLALISSFIHRVYESEKK